MNRLESISPDLANSLRRASRQSQDRACAAACELAVEKAKVEDPLVLDALRRLLNGQAPAVETGSLDILAAELDDQYLKIQEAEDSGTVTPSALQLFAQARATAAISFATKQKIEDAIYEAAVAIGDDKTTLISLVASLLN